MDNLDAVPFGNSAFQIAMEINKNTGDARKYRHILLQLSQKERALKECDFRRKRIKIDIDEIIEKQKEATGFTFNRLAIDLEEKMYQLDSEEKVIKDALLEVAIYKKHIEKLPMITRNEFEAQEYDYWKGRLLSDARREELQCGSVTAGTSAALESIGILVGRDETGKLVCATDEKKFLEVTK